MRSKPFLLTSLILVAACSTRAFAAGSVTVASDGIGGTIITGDAEDNSISVSDPEGDNNWLVVGAHGTTVNGGASANTGVLTGRILINLSDGNDSLKVSDGSIAGDLTILLGVGDDKASLSGLTVGTYLHFEGNAGDDKLSIKDVTVTDPSDNYFSTIDMDDGGGGGTGSDKAKIATFSDQDLAISLGGDADKLTMINSVLPVGPFSRLTIDAGDGTDKVKLKSVTTVPLTVETGAGDRDSLKILDCTASTNSLTDSAGTGDKLLDKGNNLGTAAMGTPAGFGD